MKTIPTLCATSTGIGLSALGFVLARPDYDDPIDRQHKLPNKLSRRSDSQRSSSQLHPLSVPSSRDPVLPRPRSNSRASSLAPPKSDMTSTATCTVQTVDTYATPSSFCPPFGFSARQALRSASTQPTTTFHPRNAPDHARTVLRKRDGHTMPRGATPSFRDAAEPSPPVSPTFAPHQTPSWLKRFSFSSRDSTQSSSTRPNSSVISVAPSASGSTTPMIPSHTPPINTAPNKLVKRSTSVSKVPTSASYGGSTTKIPIPTLRRPATSHKRSATLQERRTNIIPKAENAFRRSLYDPTPESMPDVQWRNYFAPVQTIEQPALTRRRGSSTSIPNPIKRVYADRKYRPVLVSAKEKIHTAPIEFVNHVEDDFEPVPDPDLVSNVVVADRFYSSSNRPSAPETNRLSRATVDFQSTSFDSRIDERKSIEDELDRQDVAEMSRIESASSSFSVSDILPAEPQIWKQPPPIKAAPAAKYRRPGARARSNTPTSMGNRQSLSHDEPSEAFARRRDLDSVTQTAESPSISSPITEIDLRLSSHEKQSASTALPTRVGDSTIQSDGDIPLDTSPLTSSPSHQAEQFTDAVSYLAGSDSDIRSGDDEGLDSQGDTIYDSVRTRAPKSSPGRRGPSIETIFGDSPPFHIHGKHTMLRDYLQTGPLHDQGYSLKPRHSIIHEEDAVSTPARSARKQSLASSPMLHMKDSPAQINVPSSPPMMPSLSDLRQHAEHFPDITDDDDEESSWSFAEDDDEPQVPVKNRFAHLGITPDLLSPLGHASSSANTTPQRPTVRSTDRDARSSIFDWSEQQPLEKSPNGRSPPRPKTVHGKKDAETRGSRSVGRRAPSGLHTRSQSVPTAQDADGKRTGTNKFGTWGIGSKGVTEDWNEDFDFEEDESAPEEKRLDSGISMFVPKSIRDQQTNVLANIGLLRDWGLLIEELKEHKMRAVMLEVLNGGNEKMWNEVDAMIDLADQESDEQTLAPRISPPSSPSFNYDAFDEPVPALPSTEHLMPAVLFGLPESPANEEFDFFSDEASISPTRTDNGIFVTPATPGRPRKNSEAVARSVIEALQQKRLSDAGLNPEERDKVHFDTATLKRIIPYVQELRDRVKKVIRDAEDLLPSPKSIGGSIGSHGSRSVRRRIREAPDSPTIHCRSRRSTNALERTTSDERIHSPTEELNARLRLMAMT
ncbi:hypothetical protein E4T47_02724 [Aureobasidium subglaciale]|nr:hypothetical protein E4T47_02724 [Aureobasidium subglaciale]